MKKVFMIALVVAVVGMVVVPVMAFQGGFKNQMGDSMMRGYGYNAKGTNNQFPTEEEYNKWIDDQIANGWLTEKRAELMKENYSRRLNGWTEEEFYARVDEQVAEGWITQKQAQEMKDQYQMNKERFGSAPFMRDPRRDFGGRGMKGGRKGGNMKRDFGYNANGVNNQLPTEEEYNKWIDDQVANGWLTEKRAEMMKENHSRRINGWTEEEFYAHVDEQVAEGWITQKQAQEMKDRYQMNKERFGSSPFMNGTRGNFRGHGMKGGQMGGRGMMGGRGW